jgi:NDP-sugar pyrophosphorylase family protein
MDAGVCLKEILLKNLVNISRAAAYTSSAVKNSARGDIQMSELSGVILAAGRGSRLYPITERLPKPLVPIGDRTLIEYQIDILKKLGIDKCFVVIGHFGFAYTANKINGRFLLMLGDIFFETRNIQSMLQLMQEKQANGILATKIENDHAALKKNFAVYYDEEGLVYKVVEKPTMLVNNIKGCGMYLFDSNIFEAVNRTPRTALRNEYELTDSIQIFIDLGYKVYYSNVISEDLNITFLKDLFDINMNWLKKHPNHFILGENVEIGKNVELHNVAIGDNVKIEENVVLNDTLVLSDARIEKGAEITHAIVTRDNVLRI